jgi:hypothetical protein
MVQRETRTVRVDAAEEQICGFGMVESCAVQKRRCHSCYRDSRRQALDELPEDVHLVPSGVFWCCADKAVKVA